MVSRTSRRLTFVGENNTVTATDDIVVEPTDSGGSTVTYSVDRTFKGLVKLAAPFLRREYERLGDEVERTLPSVLERL